MLVLPRREAVRFRAALRRCVIGRPRGLAPPIACQQTKDCLTLSTMLGETALSLSVPATERATARMVIPFAILDAIGNSRADVALLEDGTDGLVRCQLQEGNETKEVEETLATPVSPFPKLPVPNAWGPTESTILTALHACGKTAAREVPNRYGLTRLQLRGEDGQIIGTDGHELLIWGGFRFPFPECVLVPAVPIFGARELVDAGEVRIGRTPRHVVVTTGAWTVWLTIDSQSRFPDASEVIPKSSRVSRMLLDEQDAAEILRAVQGARRDNQNRVTVSLNFAPQPSIRIDSDSEMRLARSTGSGPAMTLAIDSRYLERALSLGFREIRAASSQEGVHFREGDRSYVVAKLHDGESASRRPAEEAETEAPEMAHTLTQTGHSMMKPGRNHDEGTEGPAEEPLDVLGEAEALRAALTEVGRRTGRLIAGLRQFQKQRRALQSAWTSLKNLRLTSVEEP
jgi:hypothetical protein